MNVMLSLSKHLYRAVAQNWAARPRCFALLSMTFCFIDAALPAAAQQPAPRVYTYVEQMPQLPGGGGMATIVAEFQKRLRFPAVDLREQLTGRALIYLEVNSSGMVQHIRVLRTAGSAKLDSAFVSAAKALPRFTPGRQNGRPVTVSLTLPITICLQ